MPKRAPTTELIAALEQSGGAERWRALAGRFGRTATRRARAHREITTLLPRICAHRSRASSFDTRIGAAMEWLPHSVAVTGLAACALYGLIDEPPRLVRLTAPTGLHVRSPAWLRLRRCVVASTMRVRKGVRIVSVAEALVHAWEEERGGRALEAIFTALRRRKATVAEIRTALDYYPRVRGRRKLLAFLSHLNDGMHSWLEYEAARTVLNTPDLVALEYQVRFIIEGNDFYVDRYHRATKTAIELDSKKHHGSPERQARDRWRDGLLATVGVATVRVPSGEVFKTPQACRARIRSAIAARAGPP